LLFFGFVRHYKGLDILYHALQANPQCDLWVAGDFWQPQAEFDELARKLGIASQVTVFPGYLDKDELPDLFACCDALVLPYRSGTGSALRELGHSQGLPVIASNVGAISAGIEPGVDGFVVTAGDAAALAAAISDLPSLNLKELRASAPKREAARNLSAWRTYAAQLLPIDN
jgi:glycosyltransferase involved in cell wall biosynthesis